MNPILEESAEVLRLLTSATGETGAELFRVLARHAALLLGARYAFAAETTGELGSRSLAFWEGSGFGEDFSYRFPGTPCERVAEGHVCSTRTGLREAFPQDLWLQQIGADSYLGVPMKTAGGRVLGHIAVLHTEPLHVTERQVFLLQLLGVRGCAELERAQAERALRAALAEVERLKEQLQRENAYLQEEIRSDHNFGELIGGSSTFRGLVQAIESISSSDATVLITGETGAGKELVARAIHQLSARRQRPLVKLNCGAISSGLAESELFGHVRGAFTGALQRRVGRFELAHGGTLFLDEIGELSLETQVKLLRVLQEQEFEPVGSSQTQRVDVRVIAASNRNLEQAVSEGRFRADLYYRLNVIPLRVPPLRERRADIEQLALYFMQRAAAKAAKPVRGIATSTLERLLAYDWPGNVRELENLIERAVVWSSGPTLELDFGWLSSARPQQLQAVPATDSDPSVRTAPGLATLEEVQRRHFLAALEQTGWVIEGSQGAAQLLALTPSTVRARMKKLGIQRPTRGPHRVPTTGGGQPQQTVAVGSVSFAGDHAADLARSDR